MADNIIMKIKIIPNYFDKRKINLKEYIRHTEKMER